MKFPLRTRWPGPGRRVSAERGGAFVKLLMLLLVLAVLAVAYLLHPQLLRAAADLLIVEEALQPSDAIVVLGNDNFSADRASRAAGLYRERWAPRVIASGAYLRPYASVADLMRRDLHERGVPLESIVYFPNFGANTREEAYAVRGLLREKRWRRVLVVTSSYHTRRARYIYRRALDAEMQVRIVAAPDSDFNPERWWQSRLGLKIFVRECTALLVALAEMRRREPTLPQPARAPAGRQAPF